MSEKIKNFTISFSDNNPVEKSGSFYVDLESERDRKAISKMLGAGDFSSEDKSDLPSGLARVFNSKLTPNEVLKKIESQAKSVRLIQLNQQFEPENSPPIYIKSSYGRRLLEKKRREELRRIAKKKEAQKLAKLKEVSLKKEKERKEALRLANIKRQEKQRELERIEEIERQKILQNELRKKEQERVAKEEQLRLVQLEEQRKQEAQDRRQKEYEERLAKKAKEEQERRLAIEKEIQKSQQLKIQIELKNQALKEKEDRWLEHLKQQKERERRQEFEKSKKLIEREQQRLRKKQKANGFDYNEELKSRLGSEHFNSLVNEKQLLFDFHQSQKEEDFLGYDQEVESNADLELNQVQLKKEAAQKKRDDKKRGLGHWLGYFLGLTKLNYKRLSSRVNSKKFVSMPAKSFLYGSASLTVFLFACIFTFYGIQVKDNVEVRGQRAINYIAQAKDSVIEKDFNSLGENFELASMEFKSIQEQLNQLGGDGLKFFSNIPYLSIIGTGKRLADVGSDLSNAALELSRATEVAMLIENPFENNSSLKSEVSLLEIYNKLNKHVSLAKESLVSANDEIEKIEISDLPVKYRDDFVKIKKILPLFSSVAKAFDDNSQIFLELLGYNGPRKYLFLFQNNHEMRATGGFIGSYGVLHIEDGLVAELFIDGIYNPGGQLKENIIPPRPIRKMSAAWSMHDSNWFPNFPDSAKKIALFYEKTGGPTVDGIFAMTPDVLIKMLEVTGPIEMSEYNITIDADNFIEKTQYEVEINYDKIENRPKKFIADLAPKILNSLFEKADSKRIADIFLLIKESLQQRHILLYSASEEIQSMISGQGWGGEVLETQKDYLMVINSNINGYKTDGIIDQLIDHEAQVLEDGTVVNTIKIKRSHKGGNTEYEWWNKVNSNFMRVYVPQGSELISVKGHTREFIKDPIDYKKLGFKQDFDVKNQEDLMEIDEETGTRIYTENGKTVFANWTYVSPQEEIVVEYKYKLPFKVVFTGNEEKVSSYSILFQKQSGDNKTFLSSKINYSELRANIAWSYPDNLTSIDDRISLESFFAEDKFLALVLKKR